jgi:hypothetical protein
MMRKTLFVGLSLVVLSVAAPRSARAASVNFSDLSQTGTGYVNFAATVHDGFTFTSDLSGPYGGLGLSIWRNDDPNHPVGGASTTSLFEYTALNTTTIAQVGNGPFSLTAIDLAPWGNGLSWFPATFPVTFVGTKSDNTTVQQTFMVANNVGQPLLQTFTFTGFTDLVKVTMKQGTYSAGTAFQFDNVVLSGGPSTGVLCETGVDHNVYSNGDTIQMTKLRFANFGAAVAPTEIKLWLGLPNGATGSILNVASAPLPASFDVTAPPSDLFQVTAAFPRGGYELSCRLLDPVTGKILSEDLRSFVIQ